MFINIKAFDAADALIYEINPYAGTLDPDGTGGTLKGLDLPGISPPAGLNEVHIDELVYEVKPKSDLTGETKTFHFVLATDRFKDNRIPPKGFDIANAPARVSQPVYPAAFDAGFQYEAAEFSGGYQDVALSIPSGAARVEIACYYQGTTREYIQFLRDEINGTATTLTSPTPSGEAAAYIAQTDPFFQGLKVWGNTMWSLWKHNHGFALSAEDVPPALSGAAFPIAGGTLVDGIVPYKMTEAVWPAPGDTVTIKKVSYTALTDKLKIRATSSDPAVTLTAEAITGGAATILGTVPVDGTQKVFRLPAKPDQVRVTSTGGGSDIVDIL